MNCLNQNADYADQNEFPNHDQAAERQTLDSDQTPQSAYDTANQCIAVKQIEQRAFYIETLLVDREDDAGKHIDEDQQCQKTYGDDDSRYNVPQAKIIILTQGEDIAKEGGGNCDLQPIEYGKTSDGDPL